MQLTQFGFCTMHVPMVLAFDEASQINQLIRTCTNTEILKVDLAWYGGCAILHLSFLQVYTRQWLCYLQLGYQVTMIFLFSSFFMKEYGKKQKKARED